MERVELVRGENAHKSQMQLTIIMYNMKIMLIWKSGRGYISTHKPHLHIQHAHTVILIHMHIHIHIHIQIHRYSHASLYYENCRKLTAK